MANQRSLTVRLDSGMYDELNRLSVRRGETLSDTVRELIDSGLREKLTADQTPFLTELIRREMVEVMENYAERLEAYGVEAAGNCAPASPDHDRRIAAFFRQCPDEHRPLRS